MTRQEARALAKRIAPPEFELDSLSFNEETGEWRAVLVNGEDPPKVVIERWDDFYTENDPEVTDERDETDGTRTPERESTPDTDNDPGGERAPAEPPE